MDTIVRHIPTRPVTVEHVLVVADWTVDPQRVVAALRRRDDVRPARWSLLVPAWLHGLDWAGDPRGSGPCAERALLTLREIASRAGLDVDLAIVGDPDPVTAVNDTCAAVRFTSLMLFTRSRRFSRAHPLDLAHRIHAAVDLPVERQTVMGAMRGHCPQALERAA